MKFNDIIVNRAERFSIGVTDEGQHYVAIPVSNPYLDYEEYYAIDQASFDRFCADPTLARDLVGQCRRREVDHLLIVPPGRLRGTPV